MARGAVAALAVLLVALMCNVVNCNDMVYDQREEGTVAQTTHAAGGIEQARPLRKLVGTVSQVVTACPLPSETVFTVPAD